MSSQAISRQSAEPEEAGSESNQSVCASPPGPIDIRSITLTGIFLLLFFYTLYFTRGLLLPLVLAVLFSLLLAPVVRSLRRFHIPEALGAVLVFLTLLGIVSFTVYELSGPAAEWLGKVPRSFQEIETKLQVFSRPVAQVTKATEQMEEITQLGEGEETPQVALEKPGLGYTVFTETQEFLVGAGIMFILLFFLLASGDLFLRKLVKVMPRLEDKRLAVEIVRQIEEDISTYLFTITVINIGLGGAIGLAMFLIGMPNPVLWGVMAGLLNFIPYFGAFVGIAAVTLVALLSFENLGQIFLVPATYFGLNVLEAYFITPMVLGHRLALNPVVIFIWLVVWGWMWGIAGALLAVPLLAMLKIVCDAIEPLTPIGEFIGR